MRLFFRAAIMAVIIILSNLTGTKAQSVTITDPNFLIFLQNSDVAPCLNGNQLDAGCPEVLDKLALE
ncbi:MAG TPA: hypothetical protein VEY71_08630, partial [Chitinophagales bacterium]|nr:hypothetical protein [Chitinophagales bacterium]